jgi:hypothetical protein
MSSTLRSPGMPSMRPRPHSPTLGWLLGVSPSAAAGLSSDSIPSALAGMAGDRKWSGAHLQPHQLDQLHLPAALRTVLAVGTGRGWTASPPRRRRWSITTSRLSRTAPGQADAEPIATCGSSALSEGLWSQLGFRNAVRGHVLPGRTAALGEQPIGLFLSARLQPRHECDSIQSRQQPEAQTVDNFCI